MSQLVRCLDKRYWTKWYRKNVKDKMVEIQ